MVTDEDKDLRRDIIQLAIQAAQQVTGDIELYDILYFAENLKDFIERDDDADDHSGDEEFEFDEETMSDFEESMSKK